MNIVSTVATVFDIFTCSLQCLLAYNAECRILYLHTCNRIN